MKRDARVAFAKRLQQEFNNSSGKPEVFIDLEPAPIGVGQERMSVAARFRQFIYGHIEIKAVFLDRRQHKALQQLVHQRTLPVTGRQCHRPGATPTEFSAAMVQTMVKRFAGRFQQRRIIHAQIARITPVQVRKMSMTRIDWFKRLIPFEQHAIIDRKPLHTGTFELCRPQQFTVDLEHRARFGKIVKQLGDHRDI